MAGVTVTPRFDGLERLTRAEDAPLPPVRMVHLGLGAFHRAHQAWYTSVVDVHDEWGIAGFTGRSPKVADELAAQGGVFTLIERSAEADTLSVVGSIVEARDGADIDRLCALMARSEVAVVTLTITESGYAAEADSDPRTSVLGRFAIALNARRLAGLGALAVVSCDNLSHNGDVTRAAVDAIAGGIDPALPEWIDQTISFVSTSVDRITPRATEADIDLVGKQTGRLDRAVVVAEPFSDWILSGDFPAGRPRWENAGAQFVDDIAPFERRKLWLLNGAHSLLAYVGRLAGHSTVSGAFADPIVNALVNDYWDLAAMHLPEVGLDVAGYRRQLGERFSNPRISHQLDQIAQDGIHKLRERIVPVIERQRSAGAPATAAWRAVAALGEHVNMPTAELLAELCPSWAGDDGVADEFESARANLLVRLRPSFPPLH